jgi:dipeptidyl aminopeptidase/acylaminoacyl peptidase
VIRSGKRRLLVSGGDHSGYSYSPAWAPDGRHVVYIAEGGLAVWRWGAKSSRVLTPGSEYDLDRTPAWSPDGSRIAFVRNEAGPILYLIRPGGGTPERVTVETANNPSWSPDGTRLAFDDGRRIGIVVVRSGRIRYLPTAARGSDVGSRVVSRRPHDCVRTRFGRVDDDYVRASPPPARETRQRTHMEAVGRFEAF